MDIAAGVFLIIAAVLNFFAAIAYNARAKLMVGAANLGDATLKAAQSDLDPEGNVIDADMSGSVTQTTQSTRTSGRGFQLLAVFLFVSVAILVVGAVFLFSGSNPIIILVAGAIALLAELLGSILSKFGPSNIPGLIGGGLSIFVATQVLLA